MSFEPSLIQGYTPHTPHVLADGELRVRLQSASGQRTAWTVAGHSSRGWQNGTVPVQSPSEFQVSGAVLGAIPGCWSLSLCITPNNLSSLADYL